MRQNIRTKLSFLFFAAFFTVFQAMSLYRQNKIDYLQLQDSGKSALNQGDSFPPAQVAKFENSSEASFSSSPRAEILYAELLPFFIKILPQSKFHTTSKFDEQVFRLTRYLRSVIKKQTLQ